MTIWTKICGITDPETATMISEAGPSAVGLNFYPKSKRFLRPELAVETRNLLPREIEAVGLFVNAGIDQVCQTAGELDLRLLQLHGGESPEDHAAIRDQLAENCGFAPRFLWVHRTTGADFEPLLRQLDRCDTLGLDISAVLVDAAVPGQYGGTGHRIDWTTLAETSSRAAIPPLVLAGGLTPKNVAEAIEIVRPFGVDVAGGVEAEPGRKADHLVREFLAAVRSTGEFLTPDRSP